MIHSFGGEAFLGCLFGNSLIFPPPLIVVVYAKQPPHHQPPLTTTTPSFLMLSATPRRNQAPGPVKRKEDSIPIFTYFPVDRHAQSFSHFKASLPGRRLRLVFHSKGPNSNGHSIRTLLETPPPIPPGLFMVRLLILLLPFSVRKLDPERFFQVSRRFPAMTFPDGPPRPCGYRLGHGTSTRCMDRFVMFSGFGCGSAIFLSIH